MTLTLKLLLQKVLTPTGVFLLLALFGVVMFVLNLHFPESSYNFTVEAKKVELTPEAPIVEVFTATTPNLDGVNVRFGSDGLLPGESLQAGLYDAQCEVQIARDSLGVWENGDHIYRHFAFAPQSNSQGKSYCLSIVYFTPFGKDRSKPFIHTTEGPAFNGVSFHDVGRNMTFQDRSLQIRPTYTPSSLHNRLTQLENRLSQYKPVFMKGHMLTLGFVLLVFSLGFIFLLQRALEHDER